MSNPTERASRTDPLTVTAYAEQNPSTQESKTPEQLGIDLNLARTFRKGLPSATSIGQQYLDKHFQR